jgi:hypothetical protein
MRVKEETSAAVELENTPIERARRSLARLSGQPAEKVPTLEALTVLYQANDSYSAARGEYLSLQRAHARLSQCSVQMAEDIRTILEKDVQTIIELAKSGNTFDPWSLLALDVGRVRVQHERLTPAVMELVARRLPAAARACLLAQVALIEGRAGLLDSILERRLAKIAALSAPLAAMEGAASLEIKNDSLRSTQLRLARDR